MGDKVSGRVESITRGGLILRVRATKSSRYFRAFLPLSQVGWS
jgi:hypothetical protein